MNIETVILHTRSNPYHGVCPNATTDTNVQILQIQNYIITPKTIIPKDIEFEITNVADKDTFAINIVSRWSRNSLSHIEGEDYGPNYYPLRRFDWSATNDIGARILDTYT